MQPKICTHRSSVKESISIGIWIHRDAYRVQKEFKRYCESKALSLNRNAPLDILLDPLGSIMVAWSECKNILDALRIYFYFARNVATGFPQSFRVVLSLEIKVYTSKLSHSSRSHQNKNEFRGFYHFLPQKSWFAIW